MLARTRAALAKKKGDDGFTLIELLVVVIIIGILAAIAIPIYLHQKQKAVDSSIKSDLKTIANAEETYAVDNASATPPYSAVAADLGKPALTTGNVITVAVSTDNTGYCIMGENPQGSGGATNFFWYDSLDGGLHSGAPAAAYPGGATSACSSLFGTPGANLNG